MGPSFIKASGEFRGRELQYWHEDDKSCTVDTIKERFEDHHTQLDISQELLLFD